MEIFGYFFPSSSSSSSSSSFLSPSPLPPPPPPPTPPSAFHNCQRVSAHLQPRLLVTEGGCSGRKKRGASSQCHESGFSLPLSPSPAERGWGGPGRGDRVSGRFLLFFFLSGVGLEDAQVTVSKKEISTSAGFSAPESGGRVCRSVLGFEPHIKAYTPGLGSIFFLSSSLLGEYWLPPSKKKNMSPPCSPRPTNQGPFAEPKRI